MSDQTPSNVVQLRPAGANENGYDGLTCTCGSAWFTVEAITVRADLAPSGYVAPLRCHECGAERMPPPAGV